MKTFNNLITEISYMNLKRVHRRAEDERTSMRSNIMVSSQTLIGWFSTKMNLAAGFNIHTLESPDNKWLKDEKVNLTGVYRVVSDRDTNIIKLNLTKGTVAFVDNQYLEDTGDVKFKKAIPYTKVLVDWKKDKEFGIR